MRQFVKRISIFGFAVLLFFIAWRIVLLTAMANVGSKATNSATVFIGDSRINYLYKSPDNYGITAEPIVYSYYKIRYMLSQRKLDTVVLSFGYNSIASSYNDLIVKPVIIERYYPYLPDSMQLTYLAKMQHPRMLCDRTMDLITKGTVVVGCYDDAPLYWRFSKDECNKRLAEQYGNPALCELNLQYLDSINVLCNRHHVKLILLNPPAHPYYEQRVPESIIAAYNKTVARYTLWNLAGTITEDSLFLADGDHVTISGAAIMTRKIDSIRALAH